MGIFGMRMRPRFRKGETRPRGAARQAQGDGREARAVLKATRSRGTRSRGSPQRSRVADKERESIFGERSRSHRRPARKTLKGGKRARRRPMEGVPTQTSRPGQPPASATRRLYDVGKVVEDGVTVLRPDLRQVAQNVACRAIARAADHAVAFERAAAAWFAGLSGAAGGARV